MGRTPVRWLATTFICCLAVLLGGCPPDTVQVGAVLPLTGDAATYGVAVKKGMDLAFEEIQADEDFEPRLSLEVKDSGSDPEKAQELLAELYGAGASVVIGGVTSGEAKQMIDVVDRYDRILLSPTASSPELTGISRNFYRIWPSDDSAATKMAQSAAQALDVETIVIIAEAQPYARGIQAVFEPAFEGFGGEVLEVIEFPPNTTDLAALVARAVSLEPDGVYLAGYAESIGSMIQELRAKSYDGKILTTSAFATPSAIARVGEDGVGVFLTQTVFEPDSDHAHIQKFVTAFKEKYGEVPDIYAAHGYDVMKVLAEALRDRPNLPGEVKKGLRDSIKEFPGVTGSIQFDDKGDVRKFPRLYVIGSGQLLVDYNERVRQKQEEIRKKREALRRQLEEIQKKASSIN